MLSAAILNMHSYWSNILITLFSHAWMLGNPIPNTSNKAKDRSIPGWTEYVAEARSRSIFWHNIWVDCDRSHSGVVANTMRTTRAAYHYAIRYVRKNEAANVRQRFANSVLSSCTRDFWTEVKRLKHNDRRVSSNIDGCYDNTEIANVLVWYTRV